MKIWVVAGCKCLKYKTYMYELNNVLNCSNKQESVITKTRFCGSPSFILEKSCISYSLFECTVL